MKNSGKTNRPFGYDLSQIPDDYTVEVTNRFQRLDLVAEGLKNYGWRFITLYHPQEKEMEEGKVIEEALQIAEERRRMKS